MDALHAALVPVAAQASYHRRGFLAKRAKVVPARAALQVRASLAAVACDVANAAVEDLRVLLAALHAHLLRDNARARAHLTVKRVRRARLVAQPARLRAAAHAAHRVVV